jgi:hypothetical protein
MVLLDLQAMELSAPEMSGCGGGEGESGLSLLLCNSNISVHCIEL